VGYHLLHDRWHWEQRNSQKVTFSLTALAGMIKEMTDRKNIPPTFSYKDLIADGLGILAGIYAFTR